MKTSNEKSRRRMVSTTTYIDEEKLDALKAIARRRRVPWNVVLREAVDAVLEKEEQKAINGY